MRQSHLYSMTLCFTMMVVCFGCSHTEHQSRILRTKNVSDGFFRTEYQYYLNNRGEEIEEGPYVVYPPSGRVGKLSFLRNGKEDGPYAVFDENGNIIQLGFRKNCARDGEYLEWYLPSGKLKMLCHYDDGVPVGNAYVYYESGAIRDKYRYKDGKVLYHFLYDESGDIESITIHLSDEWVYVGHRDKKSHVLSGGLLRNGNPWSGTFYMVDDERLHIFGEGTVEYRQGKPFSGHFVWRDLGFKKIAEGIYEGGRPKTGKFVEWLHYPDTYYIYIYRDFRLVSKEKVASK